MFLAKRADISRDSTLRCFFLKHINDSEMERHIRQMLTVQDSLSSLNNNAKSDVNLETLVKFPKSYEESLYKMGETGGIRKSQSSSSTCGNFSTRSEKSVNVYCIESIAEKSSFVPNSDLPFDSRILGIASICRCEVSFLCDSGADESILNLTGYNKIRSRIDVQIEPYDGPNFKSASVTDLRTQYDLILGRDILSRIPSLNKYIVKLRGLVQKFAIDNITRVFCNHDKRYPECFVVQRFEDDKQLRQAIETELNKVASKLYPGSIITHEIKLINPNQPPIKQKTRP
ncbi:hypothetical protein BpHYR1_021462, partial [Brachionus plicatilis]